MELYRMKTFITYNPEFHLNGRLFDVIIPCTEWSKSMNVYPEIKTVEELPYYQNYQIYVCSEGTCTLYATNNTYLRYNALRSLIKENSIKLEYFKENTLIEEGFYNIVGLIKPLESEAPSLSGKLDYDQVIVTFEIVTTPYRFQYLKCKIKINKTDTGFEIKYESSSDDGVTILLYDYISNLIVNNHLMFITTEEKSNDRSTF